MTKSVRYISTRGTAPALGFADVLLAGLAGDGGLYVPESWPTLSTADLRALRGKSYEEIAFQVIAPFVGDDIPAPALKRMIEDSYAPFRHVARAPLRQLAANHWLMELFHGPTYAFKDYALQLVGRMFDYVLAARDERVAIVGATSGDTGSAAIEACRDRAAIDIFILHPAGLVSDVQRRQMTTVDASNVHNIAVQGTFDDCQDLVKAMFADVGFRSSVNLSAVNSINWARIMAQSVYYVAAAVALGAPDRPVSFSVPTGNFGNVFAAWVARKMGLPIPRLIIGSNRNDILTRFLRSNDMTVRDVEPSLSPSMDIQISSNFERLLFEETGRDGGALAAMMSGFRQNGRLNVPDPIWRHIGELFSGAELDDAGTVEIIRRLYDKTGLLIDPHSAVGVHAAEQCGPVDDEPVVTLATAHPAKFPAAIKRAIGAPPDMPAPLEALFSLPERMVELDSNIEAVEAHVRAHVGQPGGSA